MILEQIKDEVLTRFIIQTTGDDSLVVYRTRHSDHDEIVLVKVLGKKFIPDILMEKSDNILSLYTSALETLYENEKGDKKKR